MTPQTGAAAVSPAGAPPRSAPPVAERGMPGPAAPPAGPGIRPSPREQASTEKPPNAPGGAQESSSQATPRDGATGLGEDAAAAGRGVTPPRRPAGRAAPRTPAGGGLDADGPPPAGSRTWTIELPAGMKLLSLNGRVHWSERRRRNQAIKDAAIVLARQAGMPALARVSVVAEYQPPDRRRRDPDNIMAAAKSAIDGIAAAGVIAGDDSRYVTAVTCRIGGPFPKGRLVLHVTEVAA